MMSMYQAEKEGGRVMAHSVSYMPRELMSRYIGIMPPGRNMVMTTKMMSGFL